MTAALLYQLGLLAGAGVLLLLLVVWTLWAVQRQQDRIDQRRGE